MRRDQALKILADHKDELRDRFGVTSIAIFGSTARDEARPDSDVDTLIEIERPAGFFTMAKVNFYLEDILGVKVDLVTSGALKSPIRKRIYENLIYVGTGSEGGYMGGSSMSNDREWHFRLNDIRDSTEKIQRYVRGMDFDAFSDNEIIIDAVVRNFEIIGEAARNTSDEFKASHPQIDWQGMTDMRNRLIHGYSDVNLATVWDTIVNDLPPLLSSISELIESHPHMTDHN